MTELLTTSELRALELTVELENLLAGEVIGNGPTRKADVTEMCVRIHDIQNMIMSQAAARAYPDRFRLLGENPRR